MFLYYIYFKNLGKKLADTAKEVNIIGTDNCALIDKTALVEDGRRFTDAGGDINKLEEESSESSGSNSGGDNVKGKWDSVYDDSSIAGETGKKLDSNCDDNDGNDGSAGSDAIDHHDSTDDKEQNQDSEELFPPQYLERTSISTVFPVVLETDVYIVYQVVSDKIPSRPSLVAFFAITLKLMDHTDSSQPFLVNMHYQNGDILADKSIFVLAAYDKKPEIQQMKILVMSTVFFNRQYENFFDNGAKRHQIDEGITTDNTL